MINLLTRALSQYGVKEIKGEKHNPQIVKYFQEIGHEWVKDDETAWCSAFINWVAKVEGYEFSGKLNARSWLNVGASTENPNVGDIVVFWRVARNDWRGHVGIYIREDDGYIYTLGGNQSNEVKISPYPKYRLLGYRKLRQI